MLNQSVNGGSASQHGTIGSFDILGPNNPKRTIGNSNNEEFEVLNTYHQARNSIIKDSNKVMTPMQTNIGVSSTRSGSLTDIARTRDDYTNGSTINTSLQHPNSHQNNHTL